MQDTGDTRETPAIDVCKGLMADNARINIYDPKVTEAQIHNDLSLDKFMWDHPRASGTKSPRQNSVSCFKDAYSVCLSPASRPQQHSTLDAFMSMVACIANQATSVGSSSQLQSLVHSGASIWRD